MKAHALRAVLAKGYFPKELPPAFKTETFANYCFAGPPPEFELKLKKRKLKNNFVGKAAVHNLARAGTLRRKLSLPNPINQYQIAKALVDNWKEVKLACSKSEFSLSTPRYSHAARRAISPRRGFDSLPLARARARAGARYIVTADLNTFYPGIYTHSVPWALHTKAIAKAKKTDHSLLGNVLDTALRNAQDQQTLGIPIGPDTSLVIAEILLSHIDVELKKVVHGRCHRYIDDYEFGMASVSDAESVLGCLQQEVGKLELQLNPRKTRIVELPAPLEAFWVPHLRLFPFRPKADTQQYDLLSFFGRAFELASNHPDESILRYAINRLSSVVIQTANWRLYEDLLLQCISCEPGTAAAVVRELYKYQLARKLDRDKIRETFERLVQVHAPQGHGSEVAWALWGLKTLGISISADAAEASLRTNDPIVSLCVLDLNSKGLIRGAVDLSPLHPLLSAHELTTENWLVAYEANVKGWAPPATTDYVMADKYFSGMKAAGVTFYDDTATLDVQQLPATAPILAVTSFQAMWAAVRAKHYDETEDDDLDADDVHVSG
jgi:hypothetical protein